MSTPIARVPGLHVPATPSHDPRTEKLRRAAAEFESLLVKQLLKAAKIGGDSKATGTPTWPSTRSRPASRRVGVSASLGR